VRNFPIVAGAALFATLAASPAQAQSRDVTGHVLNAESRTPIAEASVVVPGTLIGVRTNDRGEFRLRVPGGQVTILARAIGYQRREVTITASQTTAEFSLDKDVLSLEGVVVTGQATTIDRRNAAVAVSQISTEQLNAVPAASLENALQGKVVGALINMNSGAPGGGGQMQIRGVTSLNGQGDPLYVVDGVIISNAAIANGANSITQAGGGIAGNQDSPVNRLADINPNQIESIEVLKGAAASSIYGAKATNGVVIITTKRGQAGATKVDFTQRLGTYAPERLLGSRHFQSQADLLAATDPSNAAAMAIANSITGAVPYYDFQGQLYGQRSLSYETVGAVSGGSDQSRYYVSASQKRDGGTLINTEARLQSLRANFDQNWGSKWTFSAGAALSRTLDRRGVGGNDNTFISPIYNFAYTPAVFNMNSIDPNTGLFVRDPYPGGGGSAASNPFETLTYARLDDDVSRLIANGRLNYQAYTSDRNTLTLSILGGGDTFAQSDQVYSPNFLQYEPNDKLLGTAVQSFSYSRQTNGTAGAVWNFSPLNKRFSATTSAGVTLETQNLNTTRIQALGLLPTVQTVASPSPAQTATNATLTANVDQAIYAQEEFLALQDKLLLTAGLRAERSSVNGDDQKYFVFPKFAGSYRLESPVRGLDNLKLRAAVGSSGNRPNYGNKFATLSSGGIINGQNSIVANTSVGNPNIEPEVMHETELGVDATALNNRAALEVTHFNRDIKNLLLQAPLAPSSGLGSAWFNGGELQNKGWELALTLIPIQHKDLNWTMRTSYYDIKNMVVQLPVPAFVYGSTGFGAAFGRTRIAQGASTTSIWGNTFAYCHDAAPATTVHRCLSTETGFRKDTIIGDGNPKFQMQFTHDITFRSFALSALFDWKYGGQTSDLTQNLFDEGQNSWDYDKPSPNPGVGATLGAYRYNSWQGGQNATAYVQNSSYLKLREITLNWTAPVAVLNHFGVQSKDLRFGVTGRNLYMWTKYWSFDPEVNNFGNNNVSRIVDLAPYPPSRSVFFTIGVGF
jgi:TonB-dependent starch-binding outer membrane protein SusC